MPYLPESEADFYPENGPVCKVCECMLEEDMPFLVEKAWKKYDEFGWDVVFEMTICMECLQDKQQGISEQSRQHLTEYMQNIRHTRHVNGQCFITGKPLSDCNSIQGAAIFNSPLQQFFFLSDDALEEIQELLSPETREFLDGFTEEQFGPPGAWKDLFSPTRPMLM
jgi:hypothetical protein